MTGYDMTCDLFADLLAAYLEGECSPGDAEAVDAHAASCEACGALLADLLLIPEEAAALPALVPSRDLWEGIAERIDAKVLPMAPRPFGLVSSSRRGWVRPAIAAAALVLFTAGITHLLTRASLQGTAAVASAPVATRPEASATVAQAPVASEPTAEFSSTETERPDDEGAVREPASASARSRAVRGGSGLPAAAPMGGTVRMVRAEPLLHEAEPVYDKEITKLRTIVRERRSQLDPRTVAVLEQSVAVIDSAIAQSRAALARDPASGFLASQLNHSLEKKVELLRTVASLPART